MSYSKYPWDLWFDGNLHHVTTGPPEDEKTLNVGLKHLRTLLIRHLYRRNRKAYLAAEIMGKTMRFQVFPTEESATWGTDVTEKVASKDLQREPIIHSRSPQ